ncbi:hypothetical protein B5B99_01785 [Staphylococcus delphini]|nr:hypothetical protein B5B99_01785 [Staphylococcus delphini]
MGYKKLMRLYAGLHKLAVSFAVFDKRLPRRLRLLRDQLVRKIHQRFNKCNCKIKALVSWRNSPRKREAFWAIKNYKS